MEENKKKISDHIVEFNNQYMIANKPAGMPSQPDSTGDTSMYQLMEIYAKHKIHVVNRLDRPVSGLMIFTKKAETNPLITSQFKDRQAYKEYLALVEKKPPKDSDVLEHMITKNGKAKKAFIAEENDKSAKLAKLSYELIHSFDNYHLLLVRLYTGRFHQIRTQLSHIGCPIKGDVKYGARRKNKDRSIHLHAYKISFKHPIDNKQKEYIAPIPDSDGLWKDVQNIMDKRNK